MLQPILFTKCACNFKGDVWLHALLEEIDPDNLDRVPDNLPRPAMALIPRAKFPTDFNPLISTQTQIFKIINSDYLANGCEWIKTEENARQRRGGWLRINQ